VIEAAQRSTTSKSEVRPVDKRRIIKSEDKARVTGHLPYNYAFSLGKRYQSPDSEALFGNIPNPCGV